jgi:hypothetical protein
MSKDRYRLYLPLLNFPQDLYGKNNSQFPSYYSHKMYTPDDSILYDVMPCSPVEVKGRFGGRNCFIFQCRRVIQTNSYQEDNALLRPYMVYFSVLKMEATCFSENPINFPSVS